MCIMLRFYFVCILWQYKKKVKRKKTLVPKLEFNSKGNSIIWEEKENTITYRENKYTNKETVLDQ
jgi:hypothetical protein